MTGEMRKGWYVIAAAFCSGFVLAVIATLAAIPDAADRIELDMREAEMRGIDEAPWVIVSRGYVEQCSDD